MKATPSDIREKLYNYIHFANDEKVEAIYTLLKDEIKAMSAYWQDPDFVNKLEESSVEYETKRKELRTWEEIN